MKRIAVLSIFILVSGFVSAQAYRETRIYVPPVDGVGYIDDLAWFYRQLTGEINQLHRTLGKSRRFSDYVISGRLMPVEGESIELLPGSENDEYVLYVELFDNALNEAVGNQYVTYLYPDENTANALSVIVYNMLSPIPDTVELYGAEDNWRNKLIYLNASFVWSPTVYSGRSIHIASVGGEVMGDFHFLSFLGMKAGVGVSQDWVMVYENEPGVMDMILEVPAALAFVWRTRDNLMLEPYIGGVFNLSLSKVLNLNLQGGGTNPFPFSWMAGVELGVKAGLGIVTFDPRFSMDFGKSTLVSNSYEYWRYKIHLGVGYKIGFIPRKN